MNSKLNAREKGFLGAALLSLFAMGIVTIMSVAYNPKPYAVTAQAPAPVINNSDAIAQMDNRIKQLETKVFESKMTPVSAFSDTSCWGDIQAPSIGDRLQLQSAAYQPDRFAQFLNEANGSTVALSAATGPYGITLLGTGDAPKARYAVQFAGHSLTPGMEVQVLRVECSENGNLPTLALMYQIGDFCQAQPDIRDIANGRRAADIFLVDYGTDPCH